LRLSFHNLSTTCISVAYQNVRSLNKNVSHILSDAWYLRNNVLCFAETFTVNTDVILIPGFHCFYRSDNYIERKPRGLMCFVKVDESISVVHTEQVNNGNHHIDLILFQLGSTSFITSYKSPKTPDPVFFATLLNLIDKYCEIDRNLVILGDFNINLLNSNLSNVNNDLSYKYSLVSCLPTDCVTTDYGTQIDVILANYSINQCGTYESYFSDHKPIYCIP